MIWSSLQSKVAAALAGGSRANDPEPKNKVDDKFAVPDAKTGYTVG